MNNRPKKDNKKINKHDEENGNVSHIKYGDYQAIVYLNKFLIDKGTMAQIHKMLIHPATNHMRIMPDCHRGSGCCVGYTSYLTTKIVPKFIGGDIGCGMITYQIPSKYIDAKFDVDINQIIINSQSLATLDTKIRQLIPMGSGQDSIFKSDMLKDNIKQLKGIWTPVINNAYQFAQKYKDKYNVDISSYIPDYSLEWLKEKCQQIRSDFDNDMLSLGTLGGGNHFIEFNKSENDELYVTIHSGSRNIGQKICQYHQNKINDTKYFDRDKFNQIKKRTSRSFQGKQFHQIMEDIRMKLMGETHHDYLEKEEAYYYYFDMIFAQQFARLNRQIMLHKILNVINPKIKINKDNIIESIHNYIDFDDFIIRKGAIRASKNSKCVIALNMRDGILICTGKGNPEWNQSAAHGAGRVINRQEAFSKLRMRKFEIEMKNVYSSSVVLETLDESPMVYRNVNIIKSALKSTVTIDEQIPPILNLKGLN